MNYGMVIYILGWILKIESVMLLLPCIVAVIYRESAGISFLITAVIALVIGTLMSLRKPTRTKVYGRDGFVTVALAWLVMSLIGGLPFTLNGDIPSYLDAVFETVSGFHDDRSFYPHSGRTAQQMQPLLEKFHPLGRRHGNLRLHARRRAAPRRIHL